MSGLVSSASISNFNKETSLKSLRFLTFLPLSINTVKGVISVLNSSAGNLFIISFLFSNPSIVLSFCSVSLLKLGNFSLIGFKKFAIAASFAFLY